MSIATRAPIFWLTIRQFSAGKAIRAVILFALAPVVFALIFAINAGTSSGVEFISDIFLELLAPTIVPLATLILATGALGNEISDRTIPYLVLKPIRRSRIVLEKYVGVLFVTALAFSAGLIATWLIVALADGRPGGTVLIAMLIAVIAGIAAYGATFLLISLVVPRALIVGIIYILIWESLLVRFIPGIKILSIRHYIQSIFARMLDHPAVVVENAARVEAALLVLAIVSAVSLALAALRLRSMNLD